MQSHQNKKKYTYGISSGKTSAIILMLSVFAFDVGAAGKNEMFLKLFFYLVLFGLPASNIFNSDIIYCGKLGKIA